MREVAFIKQNKDKWLNFEQFLFFNKSIDADQLSDLFIQLNNDISYTQTHYPKSKLNQYLNAMATNAYQKLYKKRSSNTAIRDFWTKEIPLILYTRRKFIYFTFGLFLFFVFIGVFSALYDEGFVRGILGDGYVDQTIENIKSGDPAAIYTNETRLGDLSSFCAITINNIRVGMMMYISGFILGLGTFKLLLSNSIMLGAFQTFFYQYGFLAKSMSAIWIHGSMEIFAMNIEATAGFILGTSWIFPGSLTRKQAFMKNGKESLKILMSTIPFTIFAGLLEGFTTQYYNEMPIYLTLFIIIGTLSLISYYYLIFPHSMYKKYAVNLKTILEEYDEA